MSAVTSLGTSPTPVTPPGPIRLAADGRSTPANRKVSVMAYGGGPMRPPGYGWVAINLAGIDLPDAVPLLADHDASLPNVVGQGKPSVKGGQLVVAGELATGPAGTLAAGLLADGVALQASVGLEPTVTRYIQAGDSVKVNGKLITAGSAGLTVVDRSRLFEVSLVPIGADQSTSVSIAASRGSAVLTATPSDAMTTAGTPPTVTAVADHTLTAAEQTSAEITAARAVTGAAITAAAGRETERRNAINAAAVAQTRVDPSRAAEFEGLAGQAIAAGWDAQKAELELMKLAYSSNVGNGIPPGGFPSGRRGGSADLIAASIVARAGRESAAEKAFGPHTMNALGRLRGASLADLCAASLQADHRDVPHSRSEMIKAGMSMGTFPSAIGTAGRILLEAAYNESPASWRAWCGLRPAADFRVHSTVRPNFAGNLSKLAPGGAIAHQTIGSDDAYSWQVATFARMLAVDRVDIVNDDLNMLAEVIPSMGRTAARSIADLIYQGLLSNTGSHFHSSNANLLSGGTSPLSVASLTVAVKSMRIQRDAAGNDLDFMPRVLLVPPELETTARQLLADQALARDGSSDQQPTANPFGGSLTLAVEPRLSNPRLSGYSLTAWYLFAAPMDVPGIVGFLDGKQVPTVESFGMDQDANKLQVSYRIYWDYGFSLGEPKAGVKSAGA